MTDRKGWCHHWRTSRIGAALFLLLIFSGLTADIEVVYTGKLPPETIRTLDIQGVPYFNAFELNKVIHAVIEEDVPENRLSVSFYYSSFIFLCDSPYLQYFDKQYNLGYPLRRIDNKHYIPITFLTDVLPLAVPDKASMKNGRLNLAPPVDSTIRRIIIDAGHGGKDSGAVGYSRRKYEKDIVLSVARKLKAELEKDLGVEVLLTRSDDRFLALWDRTDFANARKGDLFLSLHCNASKNKSARGVEAFFLSTAKTTEERAVETYENSVVQKYEGGNEALKRYDDLTMILSDMVQTEQLQESSDLAIKLQTNLVKATGFEDRGVKQAGFYVLRVSYMPAVLLELGFITNREEEIALSEPTRQDKIVRAIVDGVRSFKNKYDRY